MTDESEPRFEEALGRIEQIVAALERGEPALDTALARYEDGVRLLRLCYDQLERAERSVARLIGVDDQGNPITAPFDARPTASAEPGDATPDRRSPSR